MKTISALFRTVLTVSLTRIAYVAAGSTSDMLCSGSSSSSCISVDGTCFFVGEGSTSSSTEGVVCIPDDGSGLIIAQDGKNNEHNAICQMAASGTDPKCPADFDYVDPYCYHVSEPMDMTGSTTAADYCTDLGASLVTGITGADATALETYLEDWINGADCVYTWNAWSTCTATCGTGSQSRTIYITTNPSNGGAACPTSPETQSCNTTPCVITTTTTSTSSTTTTTTTPSTTTSTTTTTTPPTTSTTTTTTTPSTTSTATSSTTTTTHPSTSTTTTTTTTTPSTPSTTTTPLTTSTIPTTTTPTSSTTTTTKPLTTTTSITPSPSSTTTETPSTSSTTTSSTTITTPSTSSTTTTPSTSSTTTSSTTITTPSTSSTTTTPSTSSTTTTPSTSSTITTPSTSSTTTTPSTSSTITTPSTSSTTTTPSTSSTTTTPSTSSTTTTPSTSSTTTTTPSTSSLSSTTTIGAATTSTGSVDCAYTWETWGDCPVTCGGGTQNRTISITTNDANGGTPCPESPESQSCNTATCPIDCVVSQWSNWTECSATCGKNLVKLRTRTKTVDPVNGGTECPALREEINCGLKKCIPLSAAEKVVVAVIQTLGCIYILVILGVTMAAFILLRIISLERMIHFCEELSLFIAHLFVLFFRDRTELGVPCKWASIFLQYFFTVHFAFMPLEAVQAYCTITNVVSVGGFFSCPVNLAIGWGVPAAVTGLSAAIHHNNYVSDFSCWLNLDHSVVLATILPVGICSILAVIIVEAAGLGNFNALPSTNKAKVLSAQLNRQGIILKLPLSIGSWFFGLFAVYFQQVSLYALVFGLNIAIGSVIFFFHSLGNKEVRAKFVKLWNFVKCCKK